MRLDSVVIGVSEQPGDLDEFTHVEQKFTPGTWRGDRPSSFLPYRLVVSRGSHDVMSVVMSSRHRRVYFIEIGATVVD